MSEGDRALNERIAELVGWKRYTDGGRVCFWHDAQDRWVGVVLPDLTGRDWQQVAELLRAKPYECVVSVTWVPAGSDEPATCKASIIGDGIVTAYFSAGEADTPGLALGRAAEQALGGAE